MKSPPRPLLVLLALLALLGAGCSRQELYANVSERQANEMVALLRNAGIDADKKRAEAGQFALQVAPGQFSQAVQLLHAQGYPRAEHDTLGGVFKKDGFVTTQLEERARFMHALAQELSTTLQNIDGVIVARVHLSVPEKRRFAEKPEPAAASVFLKVRAGTDLTPHLGSIKALVVNAIEGLPYEAVTVVTFPSAPWPGPAQATANPTLAGLGTPLVATAGAGGLVLAAGGALWGWQRRRQGRPRALAPVEDRHG
jgi:type III secretion protein J